MPSAASVSISFGSSLSFMRTRKLPDVQNALGCGSAVLKRSQLEDQSLAAQVARRTERPQALRSMREHTLTAGLRRRPASVARLS
jgi:hypothetical protein